MAREMVPLRRFSLAAAMAACSVIVLPPGATAQVTCRTANRAKAVRLAKRANMLLDEKQYERAMDDLRAAYALCPEAQLRHAMGCVQESSGAFADALASFRECAREAVDDDTRSKCLGRAAALQDRLERGTLRVVAKPPDAKVFLDGAVEGRPAVVLMPVTAGRHVVEVRAPGMVTHRETVTVPGGQEVRLDVALEPEAPVPVPRTAPPPQVAEEPRPAAGRPAAAVESKPNTVWNWVGVGLSVALIGTGAGFLGQYGKDRSDARGAEYYSDGSVKRDADWVSPTNAIVGGVCAGVGVAALITSVVLWPKAPATVSAAPAPGGGVVTFAARW